LDEKNQKFFNNIPFLMNFENFRVKFEFNFCGRPTVIFRFDTPWVLASVHMLHWMEQKKNERSIYDLNRVAAKRDRERERRFSFVVNNNIKILDFTIPLHSLRRHRLAAKTVFEQSTFNTPCPSITLSLLSRLFYLVKYIYYKSLWVKNQTGRFLFDVLRCVQIQI
jgi:hypothetical protein